MTNQEIIDKLLPLILLFLNNLKAEVQDSKWDGQGEMTITGRPDGIEKLRRLFSPWCYPEPEFIQYTKVMNILDEKFRSVSKRRKPLAIEFYKKHFVEGLNIWLFFEKYNESPQTLIPNHCNSSIECVGIYTNKVVLVKKDTSEYIYSGKQIPHLLREQEVLIEQGNRMLSAYILGEIRKTFSTTLSYYEKNPMPIFTEEECLNLYTQIFNIICERKQKSNKTLLVLTGESHYTGCDFVIELIVFFIASHYYELQHLLLEKHSAELEYQHQHISVIDNSIARKNMAYLTLHARSKNVCCIALERSMEILTEDGKIRYEMNNLLKRFFLDKVSALNAEQIDKVESLDKQYDENIDKRDMVMFKTMLSLFDNLDESLPLDQIKMGIVGKAHLKGLFSHLQTQTNYEVLMLVSQEPLAPIDYKQDNHFQQHLPYQKSRMSFFNENPVVNRIRFTTDCEGYTNAQLLQMVETAHKTFLNLNMVKGTTKNLKL